LLADSRGAIASGRKTAGGEGTTSFFRGEAHSDAERADIAATGFRPGIGQMETKLFATSEVDAGFFARDVLYQLSGQQSWVVRATVPNSVASRLYRFTADGKSVIAVHPEMLTEFNLATRIEILPHVAVP
jgi:hypothetical protein